LNLSSVKTGLKVYAFTINLYNRYTEAKGLALVPLPPYRPPGASYHAGTSYQVMDWLSRRAAEGTPFDVVHFPDWQGHGYFSALARRMRTPGMRHTRVVVGPLYKLNPADP
jgi:hypothetical protein